jgi:Rrf2 family transcriptional regulator, iron-sulfur cluster assembly transcription factor
MQLSSQEEYGLRCLLQVARHENLEPLQISEIASREGLSAEYTAKLMRSLRQGMLVVSTRGQSGGYRLARPAAAITIWEALSALGGPLFSDEFCSSHPGNLRDCIHSTDCSVRALWRWVGTAVGEVLRRISLADMARGEQPMGTWLGCDDFKTSATSVASATLVTSATPGAHAIAVSELVQIGRSPLETHDPSLELLR